METIFYYVKTGKILSKDEVSALMSGYAAPTGTIGIVNKSQRVQITDGVIQNVSDIKETSSIMSQDSVLDVFTEIVNKHSQDVKKGISPRSEIRKDELDRMIREVSDRIERQKNNQKEKELEKRREKIKKIRKRQKNIKRIAIGTVIASMTTISAVGVKYITNFQKISHDTNEMLNSYHCYIKNDIDAGKTMVALNDYNELYGKPNPEYSEITNDSYNALKDMLISNGYTDEEATICISSIVPTHTIPNISVTSTTLSDKLGFVLDYEGLNYTR